MDNVYVSGILMEWTANIFTVTCEPKDPNNMRIHVLFIMFYLLCFIYHVLFIMFYLLCFIYYVLFIMFYLLCFIYYVLFIMFYHCYCYLVMYCLCIN